LLENLKLLTQYKSWANEITFLSVKSLPQGEAIKERKTRFKNIVHTLNHVYVIDSIFKAHLEGKSHNYNERNTQDHPPLEELWQMQRAIDEWYINYASNISETAAREMINFNFVDGEKGAMSRAEMILHVVNHGTYHRGFVSDMMYQIPVIPPSNDLSVFLKDRNK